MNELYWITRLDSINAILFATAFFGVAIAAISTIANYMYRSAIHSRDAYQPAEYSKFWAEKTKAISCWSAPIGLIAFVSCIFVPTTNEAYMIYGIGGTIDYLKQSDTAKRLPDKSLKAIDAWVDYITIKADSTETRPIDYKQ